MINDIQETKQKNRRAVPLQTIIVVMVARGFVVTGDPEQARLYYDDSNTDHPEEAFKLIELMNTDPCYRETARYGIEGKHYIRNYDGTVIRTEE